MPRYGVAVDPNDLTPPSVYGGRSWVAEATFGLLDPDDEDGQCLERCIQKTVVSNYFDKSPFFEDMARGSEYA